MVHAGESQNKRVSAGLIWRRTNCPSRVALALQAQDPRLLAGKLCVRIRNLRESSGERESNFGEGKAARAWRSRHCALLQLRLRTYARRFPCDPPRAALSKRHSPHLFFTQVPRAPRVFTRLSDAVHVLPKPRRYHRHGQLSVGNSFQPLNTVKDIFIRLE